jgi:hypothetical protein
MLNRKALLIILLLVSCPTAANPNYPQNLTLVGQSVLSFFWWDIYEAKLFTPSGRYAQDPRPLLLQITYKREIKSLDLVEETDNQWERFNLNQEQRSQWLAELAQMWPDVSENDSIAFYTDESGRCHFYFNQAFIGSMTDPEFCGHFANIWLAENGPYPRLTLELTGG